MVLRTTESILANDCSYIGSCQQALTWLLIGMFKISDSGRILKLKIKFRCSLCVVGKSLGQGRIYQIISEMTIYDFFEFKLKRRLVLLR